MTNSIYEEDRRALEAFIFDQDLEKFETLIAEFNIMYPRNQTTG